MFVLTPESIKKLDSIAINQLGIPGIVLMENAANGIIKGIYEFYGKRKLIGSVLIVAGKGNNAGDGFATARKLYNDGWRVNVLLLFSENEISGEAKVNLNILKHLKVSIYNFSGLTDDEAKDLIAENDLLIDAIFGTGFKGKIKGRTKKAVQWINEYGNDIIAIDVPSGVNATTGEVDGEAVNSDATITMAYPKTGFFFYPGREYVGDLKIVNIGIPSDVLQNEDIAFMVMEKDIAEELIPKRHSDSHKGTYGKVLTIAGSRGYTGAATLTSLSALIAGCGLSYLACPSSLNPIFEQKLTEVITIPVEDKGKGRFIPESISGIMNVMEDMDIIIIGPGLSRNEETEKFEIELLQQIPQDKPIVIDADGINNLKGHLDILKALKNNIVLTPHLGEFSRLTGISIEDIRKNMLKVVKDFVEEYNVVLVLKSATTVISSRRGTFVNTTGSSGLASGGTGDVLTGLIGGFLAQNVDTDTTIIASIASYIHGRAGQMCAEEKTSYSMIAGDLLEYIPKVIKEICDESK